MATLLDKTESINYPMKQLHFSVTFKVFFLSIFIFLLFSSAFSPFLPSEYHYLIETDSQLVITGSSNVNEFTCNCSCEHDFTQNTLEIASRPEGNCFDFTNASIQLTTANLNCGHKVMNKDLYETLKYKQYPHIYITLLQAETPAQQRFISLNKWLNINAITRITIAGKDKAVHFPIEGRKLDASRYHFKGEVSLKMTDFGLDPPKAMLGLIQVNDEITIHLNLIVRMLEESLVEG